MKKFFTRQKLNIISSVLAILLMWLVWIVAYKIVKNDQLIPPFTQSVKEFFVLFTQRYFWRALGASLLRTLIAFLISFLLASVCVFISGVFKYFAAFIRPIVAVFRSVPTMAVMLLIFTWQIPSFAPVIIAFLVLFPMCYTQLSEGVEAVDKGLLQMARVYGVKRRHIFAKIYLPSMAPQVVSQIGSNLSFGIKLIISAEVMASTYIALGNMMVEAQAYLNLPKLCAITLFAVIFGIVVEVVFALISKYAFAWVRGCGNEN